MQTRVSWSPYNVGLLVSMWTHPGWVSTDACSRRNLNKKFTLSLGNASGALQRSNFAQLTATATTKTTGTAYRLQNKCRHAVLDSTGHLTSPVSSSPLGQRSTRRRDFSRIVIHLPSATSNSPVCQIFFSDYSLDWTSTNLSLVDLAVVCIT